MDKKETKYYEYNFYVDVVKIKTNLKTAFTSLFALVAIMAWLQMYIF